MSTATELLRRALDRIDWVYPSDIALKDEIRTFLAAEPEAEPVKFLCDATRFKVTGSKAEGMIYGLPQNLIGKWVAFVDADNGQHLKLTKPEPARKPMTDEEMEKQYEIDKEYFGESVMRAFYNGVRFAEKHHEIGRGME
jgi:hypothetical protein